MSDRSLSINTSVSSSLTGKVLRWIHTVFQRALGWLGTSCPQEETLIDSPILPVWVQSLWTDEWPFFHTPSHSGCVSPHLLACFHIRWCWQRPASHRWWHLVSSEPWITLFLLQIVSEPMSEGSPHCHPTLPGSNTHRFQMWGNYFPIANLVNGRLKKKINVDTFRPSLFLFLKFKCSWLTMSISGI